MILYTNKCTSIDLVFLYGLDYIKKITKKLLFYEQIYRKIKFVEK